MLKLEDLKKREYVNGSCQSFELPMVDNEGVEAAKFMFSKIDHKTWQVTCIIWNNEVSPNHVYKLAYSTFQSNQKLEMVAAIGLVNIAQSLSQEVDLKRWVVFEANRLTEGM